MLWEYYFLTESNQIEEFQNLIKLTEEIFSGEYRNLIWFLISTLNFPKLWFPDKALDTKQKEEKNDDDAAHGK